MTGAQHQKDSALYLRTHPNYRTDIDAETRHREADKRFQRMLALAIWRGDAVPAGQPKPVRPLVLTP